MPKTLDPIDKIPQPPKASLEPDFGKPDYSTKEEEGTIVSQPLFDENEFILSKEQLADQMDKIISGAYVESQEALRAKERYGKTKIISWIKEKLGTERISAKSTADGVGLEISRGKDRRWWNPTIKAILGGSAVLGTTLATPSMAIGLSAIGATYLTRAGVEAGKLIFSKINGVHQAIENSFVQKYAKALELAQTAKELEAQDDKQFANALAEMQSFIHKADTQAIENHLGAKVRENLKDMSIIELQEKQSKFEKKWKIAETIAGFVAGASAGIASSEKLARDLISGNIEKVKEYVDLTFGADFDGDQVSHLVQKTKNGWVYLYNSALEVAKAKATTVLDYGDFGAHTIGKAMHTSLNNAEALFKIAQNSDVATALSSANTWLTGVLGTLGLQTAHEITQNLDKANSPTIQQKARQAYEALFGRKTQEEPQVTQRDKEQVISEIFSEAQQTQTAKKQAQQASLERSLPKRPEKQPESALSKISSRAIQKLTEKWKDQEIKQVHIDLSSKKPELTISLDGKIYPLFLNPSALLAISRSDQKNLALNIKIKSFEKNGHFIAARGVVAEPTAPSTEKALGLTPEEVLQELQDTYTNTSPEVIAKTITINDLDYTTFVFSRVKSPAMKNIAYRFNFNENPSEFNRAKKESEDKGITKLKIKNVTLTRDAQTNEPIYVFKV